MARSTGISFNEWQMSRWQELLHLVQLSPVYYTMFNHPKISIYMEQAHGSEILHPDGFGAFHATMPSLIFK